MRISLRLTLTLVAAAVVPLVVAGLLWADLGRKALEAQVRAGQVTVARRVADGVGQWLSETTGRMRLSVELFDLYRLDRESLVGALRIVYWQVEEAATVALYDETGELLVPAVYRGDDEVRGGRLPADPSEVERFHSHVPLEKARAAEGGVAVGSPYLCRRRHSVMVPIAVGVRRASAEAPWVMAAEVALRPVQDLVGRLSHQAVGVVYLLDEKGGILAHPSGQRLMESVARPQILELAGTGGSAAHEMLTGHGDRLLAASAAMEGIPWVAVVEQSEAEAFAPVRAIERRTMIVIGLALVFAIGIGTLLSSGISRPMAAASAGARAIASGDLTSRLPENGPREVRDLARAFNSMAEALADSQTEIEGFNKELQRRVSERTDDLKKAQAELLQTRKLAAIGELGAGVAHEINNPLTGILGVTQLLLRKRDEEDAETRLLRRVEEDAKRCREITMNLLRFSEQQEAGARENTDLDAIADSALSLYSSLLESRGILVEKEMSKEPLHVIANPGQIQQALLNLLSNAGHATPEGGKIRLETGKEELFAVVRVIDTGRGIPKENLDRIFEPFFTTKDDWRGAGLGLSVTYNIVESHNGTIDVESVPDEGTVVAIRLPLPDRLKA